MTSTAIARPERRTPHGTAAGVIDTIADAVTFVLQRPWLMIIPVIIDVIVWLFVRVTMAPLIDNFIRLMESTQVEGSDEIIKQLAASKNEIMISDYVGAFIPSLLTGMSMDTLMGILMLFVAPDGFGILRSDIYGPWQSGLVDTFVPSSAGMVTLIWLGALFVSSIALVLFRVPIVRAVRGSSPTSLVREMVRSWVSFLFYLVCLLGVAIAALVPLAMLTALVPILGISAAFLTTFALLIFGGILGIYSLFAVDAMLVHRTSPINGFRMSYAVGRTYFGDVARFALTSIFITLASLRLWSELAGTAPGMIVSIIGSAFIGTVLAAASLFYYTDRFRLVRAMKAGARNVPMQK